MHRNYVFGKVLINAFALNRQLRTYFVFNIQVISNGMFKFNNDFISIIDFLYYNPVQSLHFGLPE